MGIGLFLAWLGLLLPWEQWSAEATGAGGSTGGLDASPAFWIVLAVATVLAVVAVWRDQRWPFVALAVAALGLVVLALRDIGAAAAATSAFVSVTPGAGVILGLVGAAVLLVAVIVALRPPALQLAAGLAVFALATGGAAAWPQSDGRPDDGAIADFVAGPGTTIAFQGDTLYRVAGGELFAVPAQDREYAALEFGDDVAGGIAFVGDLAHASLGAVDRLTSITTDAERRILVARPPRRRRDEPAIPDGQAPELVPGFVAGPVAADGSVYVLQGDAVARWRDGRLENLAPRFNAARAIATDGRGALYVADTGNGRVHRVDPDGSVRTVVGTAAPRNCVEDGLDDPLALDPSRCTAVKALAVDSGGTVYLALKNLAMITGVTPDGRMSVVAGTGPKGVGDGDGRAVHARLGVVEALTVGPDGDLYVGEAERIRRIADPAGILASEPPSPEPPTAAPACAEIAALNVAAAGVGRPRALERTLNALADVAPEAIIDDVDAIAGGATDTTAARTEIRSAMADGLGEYAEEECGLVGGFDVPVDEANEFCVAYGRYRDEGDFPEAGEEPPRSLESLLAATPDFLAAAGRDSLRELRSAAGRVVPAAEAVQVLAGIEAISTVASAMCVVG